MGDKVRQNYYESDFSLALRSLFRYKIRDFKENRVFFRKPFLSMLKTAVFAPPWSLTRCDGLVLKISNRDDLFRERFKFLHSESYQGNEVIKKGQNGDMISFPISDNGDIYRAFVNEEYSWLPVLNRIVVDIGASIGDSPLYFAIRGSKHVYAYEPFPVAFERAQTNIRNNNLEQKITLFNNGIGSRNKLLLDPNFVPTNSSNVFKHTSEKGVVVEIIKLKDILQTVEPSDLVLKMDCEGCEYTAILDEECDVLRKFTHIQMEYHNGYINIKEKLESCGFMVSYDKPIRMKSRDTKGYIYYGYLRAERQDKFDRNKEITHNG